MVFVLSIVLVFTSRSMESSCVLVTVVQKCARPISAWLPRGVRSAVRSDAKAIRDAAHPPPAALVGVSRRSGNDRILDGPRASPARTAAVHENRRRLDRRPALPMNAPARLFSPVASRAALASAAAARPLHGMKYRPGERRVGQECASTGKTRGWP